MDNYACELFCSSTFDESVSGRDSQTKPKIAIKRDRDLGEVCVCVCVCVCEAW